MTRRTHHLHGGQTGSALTIRVTPRAGRDRIAGVMEDGTVKIQLAAAPVDGAANDKLIALLAKSLDIPRSRIEIVAGAASRNKLVSVVGLDAATLHARVLAALD